jgi:hypothetical protein
MKKDNLYLALALICIFVGALLTHIGVEFDPTGMVEKSSRTILPGIQFIQVACTQSCIHVFWWLWVGIIFLIIGFVLLVSRVVIMLRRFR